MAKQYRTTATLNVYSKRTRYTLVQQLPSFAFEDKTGKAAYRRAAKAYKAYVGRGCTVRPMDVREDPRKWATKRCVIHIDVAEV